MRDRVNTAVLGFILIFISYFSLNSGGVGGSSASSLVPLHAIAYFVLAVGFLVNFNDTDKGHLEAVFSAFAIGLLIELMQLYIPERIFSFTDMGMNLAGASIILLDHKLKIVNEIVELEDKLIEQFLAKTGL